MSEAEETGRPVPGGSPGKSAEDSGRPEAILDRRRIAKGVAVFLVLSAVGLTALFLYTKTPQTFSAVLSLRPLYLALTALLSLVDMWLGGVRNHVFISAIRPRMSFWTSFRANLSNVFMGAVTPSQTGGSPAQMFVYYRGGLSVGEGASIIVINYLSTLIFFLTAALFAMTVIEARFAQPVILYMIRIAFVIFTSQLALFLLFLWKPHLIERVLRRISGPLQRKLPLVGRWLGRMVERLFTELDSFHDSCTLFLRHKPAIFLASLGLTIALYVNKFTIAYLIMLGLGVRGSYADVLAIQALVLFILYFAPTPGGSGIAEIGNGALMAALIPSGLLPVFTALQRLFFLYVPAVTGSFIFLHELGRYAKNGREVEEGG
jgi:hypothetical protein